MYNLIFEILCCILDLFILKIYFQSLFQHKKENIPLFFRCSAFVFVEFLMLLISHCTIQIESTFIALLRTFISTFLTFLLTALYHAPLVHKIFTTIVFQALSAIAELFSAVIVEQITIHFYTNNPIDFNVTSAFVSKLLLFLFSLISCILLTRHKRTYSLSYNLLVVTTPLLSLVIIIFTPYPKLHSDSDSIHFLLSAGGLFLLNILNYYLLDNVLLVNDLQHTKKQLDTQIQFQTDKYTQLSTAYKNTRSLLHDTKKHFFYITECVNAAQYHVIPNYLQVITKELEHCYNQINTGNLVIDTFLSTYLKMAAQENIPFLTDIQVSTERIPTSDYALCIILGNLLDNSMNACRKITPPLERYIKVQIFTSQREFVIHITNSVPVNLYKSKKESYYEMEHGYGIQNIKKAVEDNWGTYTYFLEKDYESIVILPIIS